jgi:putative transposase
MRDNGCQLTSLTFMQACSTLGIQQAFTSDNNPQGHADTERVMRTFKEACLWLQKWTSPCTLQVWIADDNEHYWRSSFGYLSPTAV